MYFLDTNTCIDFMRNANSPVKKQTSVYTL